jgi:TonB family protein
MNQNINIKVMKKPELTDEEIRSHMQFDKLLDTYKVGMVRSSEKKWLHVAASVTTIVVLISGVLYFLFLESKSNGTVQPFRAHPSDSSLQIKNPEIVQSKPEIKTAEKATSTRPRATTNGKTNAFQFDSATKSIHSHFTEAEPIDGYSALYEYFNRELKYPVNSTRDSAEGIVTVSFVIDQDGKPGEIKIENSLGAAFDKECQRIINTMPLWKPATIEGKPIATKLSIPLTFKIKK